MDALTPAVDPTVVTPAAPAVVDAPTVGLHEMTRPERDQFLRDGKAPTREPKKDSDGGVAADADSSAAPAKGEKAAEIAAKDVKAASEPAALAKDKKARNSEENRVQELLSDRQRERERADRADGENRDLRKRLDALERGSKADGTTDSSTKQQPSEPTWKAIAADKTFPKIEDFESPNEWAAAVADFSQRQIAQGQTQRDQQSAEQTQQQRVQAEAYQRGATELEGDPTILDRIDPGLEQLVAARALPVDQVGPPHFAKDVILYESEKPLALMAFYSTPEGKVEWTAMMRLDRRGIEKAILSREVRLGSTVPQGDAAAGEKKPVVKTFTKAPAPPEKEGPKGAVASDGADQAVKTGDFASFQAEMDAREGVGRRYGRRRAS